MLVSTLVSRPFFLIFPTPEKPFSEVVNSVTEEATREAKGAFVNVVVLVVYQNIADLFGHCFKVNQHTFILSSVSKALHRPPVWFCSFAPVVLPQWSINLQVIIFWPFCQCIDPVSASYFAYADGFVNRCYMSLIPQLMTWLEFTFLFHKTMIWWATVTLSQTEC